MRRKTRVRPAYIRASPKGWHPTPVRGEAVIATDRLSAREVHRRALSVIDAPPGGQGRSPPRPAQPRMERASVVGPDQASR
ncbi:MAG TPA: hypothetical protein VGV89_08505 [Thermoplasmata archaeon]|nr:hypothetical protein [Thermoplasmata archaeon]